MINAPDLHIDRVELQNFRCFDECAIDLHESLTVLVAENGQGKTAILDAVGMSLGIYVDALADTHQSRGIDRADVHLVTNDGEMTPALPTILTAEGRFGGDRIQWRRARLGYGLRARTTVKDARNLRFAAHELRSQIQLDASADQASMSILPLVASYGTSRLWGEHRLTTGKRLRATAPRIRMGGYTDCLSSLSSFKGLVAWYESKMNEVSDGRFSTELARNLALLTAVQGATRIVLEPSGWSGLDWDQERRSLVVRHEEHGRLPLHALSDGVRTMIALVADVARRCATLNPHLGAEAARLTPGILMVDEIDMHLHPRWQQTVVGLLRRAFPTLQLVLTTHSPQVLSTVDKISIRTIRLREGRGFVETPMVQTRGVESADVLARIMGLDPIPQVPEAQALSRYRQLVQLRRHDSGEGLELRKTLEAHFGARHPVMLECDRLVRLESFKAKLPRSTPPVSE